MKSKPVVMDRLHTVHTSYEVDLVLENNITLVSGDSGEGKSAVYSFIEELATEDRRIRCFSYKDINNNYKNSIRRSKGKLFVIDNADLLLDDKTRRYIATDGNNQYLIIGRNPTGLLLTTDNVWELKSNTYDSVTTFTLVNNLKMKQ